MLERIALVLVLVVVAVVAYALLRRLHMRRMQVAVAVARPALLYFRGDSCAVCPAQGRYVDEVAGQWGDLTIERIDAEREPETAARYRVFSLPTTVLIDGRGQVRHVNYGLTDAHKLGRQVAGIVEQPGGRQTTDHGPQPETMLHSIDRGPKGVSFRLWSVVRRLSSQ